MRDQSVRGYLHARPIGDGTIQLGYVWRRNPSYHSDGLIEYLEGGEIWVTDALQPEAEGNQEEERGPARPHHIIYLQYIKSNNYECGSNCGVGM